MWELHSFSFCVPNVLCLMVVVVGGWGWCRTKSLRVILLSHLANEHVCAFVSNAGNERRARKERGTVVQRSKPHMFFVSYMCFLSQLCSNHIEKRREENTSFSSSTMESKEVGGRLFMPKIGPHALHVWYSLCAFPPIAWAGLTWRAGKRQQPDSL